MKQKIGATMMVATALMAGGAQADTFGSGGNQFTLDFVDIGGAGNAADGSGYGAVGYNFRIGQKEVTIDQFTKAQAASGNTIGDGDENYWNDGTRTVGPGAPASFVSWNEAARFANWLTTGSATTGVYSFDGGGNINGIDRSYRNGSGLAYVLPTEDEWYKAAYYKPANDGSYSLYANGSDNATNLTWGTSSGWNYRNDNGDYVNGDPNYMWESGFGGVEQNGTYDMMGNDWEWNESADGGDRVRRGGSATNPEGRLRSSYRKTNIPTFEKYTVGFRVAAIPEPSSIAMVGAVSGIGLFIRRKFML